MKKYIIITMTVMILVLTIITLTYEVKALDLDDMGIYSKYIQENEDSDDLVTIGNVIIWIVRRAGEAIAVLMLAIVGIRYIMGSVEEKAEYKQTMWPYILGAALIFAGAEMVNIIYEVFN